MSPNNQQLENYLKYSTVKILTPNGYGTGFFVAYDLILTCAHVVRRVGNIGTQVRLQCFQDENEYQAKIERMIVGEEQPSFKMHYPDIALLRVLPPLPEEYICAYLDETQPQVDAQAGDPFSVFGYTKDFDSGEPVDLTYVGRTGEPEVLKFKKGQVPRGISGAPALNRRTCQVCGIINYSRDIHDDLGGYAIPIDVVYHHWSEVIAPVHGAYHCQHPSWKQLLPIPPLSESPVKLAIQSFEFEKDKPIFVMHGNVQYLDDLMDSFYEYFPKVSSFPFLLLDIQNLKHNAIEEEILYNIVQELIEQFIERLKDSDKIIQMNNLLVLLKYFKQANIPSGKKMLEFQNLKDIVLYNLNNICERDWTITIIFRQFEKIGDLSWAGHIKKQLLDPLLQKLQEVNLRFFIQSTEIIKKSDMYHGSAELYALDNVKFYELIEKD